MKCSNCGAEITDGNFCKNCGAKVNEEQVPVEKEQKPIKRKDSVLSIVSCVLTGVSIFAFNWIAIGGLVCGLIDLCMNDKTKRHLGSWFGVIAGVIVLIVYIMNLQKLF